MQQYPILRSQLIDLFLRLDSNRAAIGELYRRALSRKPSDPPSPPQLNEAELIARGLEMFTTAQPRLRDNLKLPEFADPNSAFPADEYAELMRQAAIQTSTQVLATEQARAATGWYTDNWAAAKQLEDEQTYADIAAREEAFKKQQEQEQQQHYDKLWEMERRRLGVK